jgi:hypothetical protein
MSPIGTPEEWRSYEQIIVLAALMTVVLARMRCEC